MSSYQYLQDKHGLTSEEAAVVQWQYRYTSDFRSALWNAIKLADGGNLKRLSHGFPVEVGGYIKFSTVPGWWGTVKAKLNMEAQDNES